MVQAAILATVYVWAEAGDYPIGVQFTEVTKSKTIGKPVKMREG